MHKYGIFSGISVIFLRHVCRRTSRALAVVTFSTNLPDLSWAAWDVCAPYEVVLTPSPKTFWYVDHGKSFGSLLCKMNESHEMESRLVGWLRGPLTVCVTRAEPSYVKETVRIFRNPTLQWTQPFNGLDWSSLADECTFSLATTTPVRLSGPLHKHLAQTDLWWWVYIKNR